MEDKLKLVLTILKSAEDLMHETGDVDSERLDKVFGHIVDARIELRVFMAEREDS